MNDTYWYTFRPPPHVPGYFENEDFYCPFSKKHGSTRSIFKSFLPVHTKTLKRRKYYSIPHGACVMVVVYYLWHHRIRKRPSLPHSYINEEPAFSKISTLESVFWKDAFSVTVFNQKRRMISVDEALFSVHCTQRFRRMWNTPRPIFLSLFEPRIESLIIQLQESFPTFLYRLENLCWMKDDEGKKWTKENELQLITRFGGRYFCMCTVTVACKRKCCAARFCCSEDFFSFFLVFVAPGEDCLNYIYRLYNSGITQECDVDWMEVKADVKRWVEFCIDFITGFWFMLT